MKRARALLIAVLLASCRRAARDAPAPPFQVEADVVAFSDASAQAAAVRVEPVSLAGDDHLGVTGRLVWDENVTARVFAPVSGRVSRISADLGSWVKKGDPLAALSSPDYGQAQAEAARSAADLRTAERTVERVRQIYERGGAPRKDLEQAEAEVERARAEAERTRRRLRLWGGEAAEPGKVDQDFPLASPVGGLVVERNLNPGQEVRSDATTPLFVISDPHRLWVLLDVTEKELSEVSPGAPLTLRSPAFPERAFPGVLDVLGAGLDPATRTVRARGQVESREALLKAEMYVTVDVLKKTSRRRLTLPARAVIQDGSERFVFLEEASGRYRRTAVSVGPEREGVVPVLSGLGERARVVTEGSLLLEAAWAEGRKP